MSLKSTVLFLTFLISPCLTFGQTLPKLISETDFSIGRTVTIESTVLGEYRELNIYLPLSYSMDSTKTFPVIYLFDGAKDEDFIHISGIVQFGSFSWINMIPESIVVGITNTDRKRDFTSPSENKLDQKEFPTSGHSSDFIKFLELELQPFVDATFRTNGPKTIIGQSLGGLLATEILFTQPDLFDNYIIVSPSLWWNDGKKLGTTPVDYNSQKSIYIAVGKEGKAMEGPAEALYDKLELLDRSNTTLYFEFLENKTHGDALHIAVYNAFELMFDDDRK